MPVVTNRFWIAANIIFNTNTGATNNVLMLVNRESDATIFAATDAEKYFAFVSSRAKDIQWFLDPPTIQRPQGFVIRGTQTVNVTSPEGFPGLGF
jgi:hypothetical protein